MVPVAVPAMVLSPVAYNDWPGDNGDDVEIVPLVIPNDDVDTESQFVPLPKRIFPLVGNPVGIEVEDMSQ